MMERCARAIPVQVRVSVDVGIAEIVRDLQSFHGVWTHASCQGGGKDGHSFRPYVMVSWDDERARTCEDKKRVLLMSEDGKWHCYNFGRLHREGVKQ